MDHRRAFTRFVCLVCLVAAPLAFVFILGQHGRAYRLIGAVGFLLTGASGLWLLHQDRTRLAYRTVSYGTWLATLYVLTFGGGAMANPAALLPILSLFHAWLAGKRTALWLGALSIVALFVMAFLIERGLLPAYEEPQIYYRTFLLSVFILVSAGMGYFASNAMLAQRALIEASHRDIGEKLARIEHQERELRLITERMPAMIARFDREHRYLFANSAYAAFLGHTPQSLIGKPLETVLPAAVHARIAPNIERVLAGEAVHVRLDWAHFGKGKHIHDIDLTPDLLDDGRVIGWYVLIRDITESERTERALRHILAGTAHVTGSDFFRALTENLAQATGLTQALVTELLPDGRHARVLAYWGGGQSASGSPYPLADAPSRLAVESGMAFYSDHLAECFPHIPSLVRDQSRSYYGVRLDSSEGVPLGVLAVMDQAPIADPAPIASLMTIFAARAAAELERLQREADLQRSNERFSAVFLASPNPVAISSLGEGRFVAVNPAFEKTFGWSRPETIGRNAVELGIWPSEEERQRWTAALTASRRARDFEAINLTKSGDALTVLMSAEVIDIGGTPHIIAFANDVTEQRRAELARSEALERFEAIFQQTPNVAIQGYDPRGRILHWNQASERFYGIPASEAIGRTYRDLRPNQEAALAFEASLAQVCASGEPLAPGEWSIPLPAGGTVEVLSAIFPVFSQGIIVEIFCMDVDISELKAAHAALHQLNEELEARVAARTAELAAVNSELEAFTYSVSHDLRAPLRSIEGFGRLLEQDYAGRLDATAQDYIGRMRRSAQRLAQLIDDLLELSRIERAKIQSVDTDLSALAQEIIGELRQGDAQRAVQVDIAQGLRATGDRQLLRVILQNLLENAWKYSSKTADAHIILGRSAENGEEVFYVRDNGAGFDMAQADRLFTPFQRLHGVREFEGSGIGLATVLRAIKRHRGQIWAEAAPGKGATFYFTLG